MSFGRVDYVQTNCLNYVELEPIKHRPRKRRRQRNGANTTPADFSRVCLVQCANILYTTATIVQSGAD